MVTEDTDFIDTDQRDGVAWLTMDRPERHNAMTVNMAGELYGSLTAAIDAEGTRAIVLTGAGETFNTGADLGVLEGDASDAETIWAIARNLHNAIRAIVDAPVPVVTGINGVAAGGGFGLAIAGDIVLMASDARLEFAYPRIGLSGDGGVTHMLPAMVGYRRATEIAMLDEPIPADMAVNLGLATRVIDDEPFDEGVASVATQLANGPTKAFATFKRLLRESSRRSLDEQLRAESDAISRLTWSKDYQRGLAAFFGDGDSTFEGR